MNTEALFEHVVCFISKEMYGQIPRFTGSQEEILLIKDRTGNFLVHYFLLCLSCTKTVIIELFKMSKIEAFLDSSIQLVDWLRYTLH